MIKKCAVALALATVAIPNIVGAAEMRARQLSFNELDGWQSDDHDAALATFATTCDLIEDSGWATACKSASVGDARSFFEAHFVPVIIEDGDAGLFTAYYEPELKASRVRTDNFAYPIYAKPADLPVGRPWLTRAQIDGQGALKGRGLELAWLADPVEVFFLHVQGSGRLRMTDGTSMRAGFAAKNGHKYRSVGREMARRGLLPEHRLSAGAIRNWVNKDPEVRASVLWHNNSYIFFRELKGLSENAGPVGAMQRPVTSMRSIAVDPSAVPLGAPVWVEKDGADPIRSLMIAQDTGSAIKGAQRADIFFGSGDAAGAKAGKIRDPGRMIVLLPHEIAKALISGG